MFRITRTSDARLRTPNLSEFRQVPCSQGLLWERSDQLSCSQNRDAFVGGLGTVKLWREMDAQKGEQDWSDFMVPYLHARGRRRPKWAWAAVGWLDRVLPYVFKGPGSRYDPFKVIDESDDDDARRLKRKAQDESDGEIQPSRQKKNKSLGMIDLTL
ncbi:hypothetical protein C8F01DRAFT_1260897 [Mycena amicta]|nr:hypothetical protein C8F01DRAFT_1260897 [Mycena amicta]